MANLIEHPHRRLNPLTGDWVLVSPQRNQRPWQGQTETAATAKPATHDPECYLCPGNVRAGGHRNPDYKSTFVFVNDFSALYPLGPEQQVEQDACGLIVANSEPGICRVMCFSPHHDLTLASMKTQDIRVVVDVWVREQEDLEKIEWINYVQIFENRGAMMGASNPHPHCQIWASKHLPNEPAKELIMQRAYLQTHGGCLLCGYLNRENGIGERIIFRNQDFAVVAPFWATWPFEAIVISQRHTGGLVELSSGERNSLAEILHKLTAAYDHIFSCSFPYSMGFHLAPADREPHPEWHLHAHFYPPLLRSATVRKFMVGYELLGGPQRDITPEAAAARLREAIANRD